MSFWTSTRLPAEHTSPWLMKVPNRAPSTAFSKSASLKKMLGDLPPSSRETRLSWSAALRMMSLPTSALPVKAILRTFGCATSGAPAPGPSPVTMFTTPGGNPTASKSSASFRMLRGVCSAGLSTTVQPAASAGAIFQAAMSSG